MLFENTVFYIRVYIPYKVTTATQEPKLDELTNLLTIYTDICCIFKLSKCRTTTFLTSVFLFLFLFLIPDFAKEKLHPSLSDLVQTISEYRVVLLKWPPGEYLSTSRTLEES